MRVVVVGASGNVGNRPRHRGEGARSGEGPVEHDGRRARRGEAG